MDSSTLVSSLDEVKMEIYSALYFVEDDLDKPKGSNESNQRTKHKQFNFNASQLSLQLQYLKTQIDEGASAPDLFHSILNVKQSIANLAKLSNGNENQKEIVERATKVETKLDACLTEAINYYKVNLTYYDQLFAKGTSEDSAMLTKVQNQLLDGIEP